MNESKVNDCISNPDVCRCCLSKSGKWDITATYITEKGSKEVFADILQKCFGIKLSHLSVMGSSRQICEPCVSNLRNANNFQQQVLNANKKFRYYWENRINDNANKTNNVREPNANVLLCTKVKKKQEYNTRNKAELEERDGDSDVPIASLKNECIDNEGTQRNFELFGNRLNDNAYKFDKSKEKLIKEKRTKQVSERKRISSTCNIVLKDTTACPFRHHKSWFQCFYCSEGFMEMNVLRNHTVQSHDNIDEELKKIKHYPRSLQIDISKLECRLCDLTLTDIDTMKSHFTEIHNKRIYNECIADYKINSSPYSCHICKREFHVFRTLTTHLNEHYANCICDVCGKSFLNSKRLKVHGRTHENGIYPCKECGKVLKTKTAKANHMESAHSKRIIKCQICYKPMKHYNDRIKHMSEAHNITHKFQCFICGREYNIKHYLATHIRQTHGHKNKRCEECGMAFITNHGLKKHMLKHTGERPFKCTLCSKSYARRYTLKEHLRVHDTEKVC